MFKEACQLLLSSLSSAGRLKQHPIKDYMTYQLTHLKFTSKMQIFQVLQCDFAVLPHLITLAAHDTL